MIFLAFSPFKPIRGTIILCSCHFTSLSLDLGPSTCKKTFFPPRPLTFSRARSFGLPLSTLDSGVPPLKADLFYLLAFAATAACKDSDFAAPCTLFYDHKLYFFPLFLLRIFPPVPISLVFVRKRRRGIQRISYRVPFPYHPQAST